MRQKKRVCVCVCKHALRAPALWRSCMRNAGRCARSPPSARAFALACAHARLPVHERVPEACACECARACGRTQLEVRRMHSHARSSVSDRLCSPGLQGQFGITKFSLQLTGLPEGSQLVFGEPDPAVGISTSLRSLTRFQATISSDSGLPRYRSCSRASCGEGVAAQRTWKRR